MFTSSIEADSTDGLTWQTDDSFFYFIIGFLAFSYQCFPFQIFEFHPQIQIFTFLFSIQTFSQLFLGAFFQQYEWRLHTCATSQLCPGCLAARQLKCLGQGEAYSRSYRHVTETEDLKADAHHWNQQRVIPVTVAASPVVLARTFTYAHGSAFFIVWAGISVSASPSIY